MKETYSKGCSVIKEEPFLLVQTIDSRRSSLCCAHCLTYIGGIDTQVSMICGMNNLSSSVTTSKYPHREQCAQKLSQSGQAYRCAARNCSEVYCSATCRQSALWGNHALECAGSFEEMDSTMSEFRGHAYKSEEVFLAICRVITTLIMNQVQHMLQSKGEVARQVAELDTVLGVREIVDELGAESPAFVEAAKVEVMEVVAWYKAHFGATPSLGGNCDGRRTGHTEDYELSEAACESWLLLHSALVNSGVPGSIFAPLLSKGFFGAVLRSLEHHLHSMNVTSNPLPQKLIKLLSSQQNQAGDAVADTILFEELLLRKLLARKDLVSADSLQVSDKLLLISELNALSTSAGSIAAAASGPGSGDQEAPPSIFTFDGRACHSLCMVLLPYCSKNAAHSCIPNVQLSAGSENGASVADFEIIVELPHASQFLNGLRARRPPAIEVVALRNLVPGEEGLAMSFVDDGVLSAADSSHYTVQSRQDQLAARFKLTGEDQRLHCKCLRCRFETARIASIDHDATQEVIRAYTPAELLNLGHSSMQQSLYDDAKLLYSSLIGRLLGDACQQGLDSIESRGAAPDASTWPMPTATPSDLQLAGDTFHALGAAYLESGDWRRSRLVWRFGLQMSPEHTQLQEEVAKIDCYPTAEVTVQRAPEATNPRANEIYLSQTVSKEASRIALDCVEYPAPALATDFTVRNSSSREEPSHSPTSLVPYAAVSSGDSLEQRVYLTAARQPLLTPQECRSVIAATEAFAAQAGGWSTSRHYAVPTTDIPVHVVKSTHKIGDKASGSGAAPENSLLEWFSEVFSHRLGPLLALQFQDMFDTKDPITVAIHDAFVVKYDTGLPVLTSPTNLPPHQASTEPSATLQTYLPLHCDQSSHSFTIALNGMDEYVGGGTYFPSLGTVMRPDIGQVLSFPGGSILHGGEPIVRGTRYILAVFAYIAGTPAAPRPAAAAAANSAKRATTEEENDVVPAKRARIQAGAGFKDVCWKSQSQADTGDVAAEPSHLFSFSF